LAGQQLQAEHVRVPPASVDASHVDDALKTEERARGRACHAVLPGSGLRDDAPLSHPLRQERLPDRAIDLVRAGVREVLALEEHAREADLACEPRRIGERCRPAHPVMQDARELILERTVLARLEPGGLELADRRHERLGQVLPAELTVAPGPRLGDHTGTVRLIEAISWMTGAGSSARMRAVPIRT